MSRAALRRQSEGPSSGTFTQDEFVGQFAEPGRAICVVKVHKRRTHYTVGGCMTELSEVVANGRPTRTIAVESEDAAGVIRAVHELGLGGYTNTSYLRGLAALIADEPVRYAVIDVGTNSIKFHIAEHDDAGAWRTVVDRAEMTRLGEGLAPGGAIIDAALERTAAAIAACVTACWPSDSGLEERVFPYFEGPARHGGLLTKFNYEDVDDGYQDIPESREVRGARKAREDDEDRNGTEGGEDRSTGSGETPLARGTG